MRLGMFGRARSQAEFFRHTLAEQPAGGVGSASHADKDATAFGVGALDAIQGRAGERQDGELLGLSL